MAPKPSPIRSGVTGDTQPHSYSHLKAVKGGVSLHPAVRKMLAIRWKEEDYPSKSACLAGLIVFDFYCGRRHWLTARLMREPIEIQEKVFSELLEHREKRSTWIEHRIEEIIQERKRRGGKAIVITDVDGHITDANAAFTQMCGYSLAELIGKRPGELLQGARTEKPIVREFRRAIKEQRSFECTITNYHKSGAIYRVHIKMEPLFKGKTLTGFRARERRVK